MSNEVCNTTRKDEIINTCLNQFIEKGLYETTSRDLSEALNMSPSSLYYHFKNKDEAVLECAEEAAIRLENALLLPFLNALDNTNELNKLSNEVSEELSAMMRFFAQVCTANKYRNAMRPVLNRTKQREAEYCEQFAKKLNCSPEELAPFFFACMASSSSYMIFGDDYYSVKPMDFIKIELQRFREKI